MLQRLCESMCDEEIEKHFCYLLCYSASTYFSFVRFIILYRVFYSIKVKTKMFSKFIIFGSYYRLHHIRTDFFDRYPFFSSLIVLPSFFCSTHLITIKGVIGGFTQRYKITNPTVIHRKINMILYSIFQNFSLLFHYSFVIVI